jgi:hypothetical protein
MVQTIPFDDDTVMRVSGNEAATLSVRSIMNRRAEFSTLIDVACLRKVHDRGASIGFSRGDFAGGLKPHAGAL